MVLDLPGYPFEAHPYWIPVEAPAAAEVADGGAESVVCDILFSSNSNHPCARIRCGSRTRWRI